MVQKFLIVIAVNGIQGAANAGRQAREFVAGWFEAVCCFYHATGYRGDGFLREILQQEDELISAEAADGTMCPYDMDEVQGKMVQNFVAFLMSQGIVGFLEMV